MLPHLPQIVLIVDDDPPVLLGLSQVLQRAGYPVRSSGSIREALRILVREGDGIGLLLCDLSMGHDNGLELLRHARRRRPQIACVVLTGFGDWDSYSEALGVGVREFLSKPIGAGQLVGVVKGILGEPLREFRTPESAGGGGQGGEAWR